MNKQIISIYIICVVAFSISACTDLEVKNKEMAVFSDVEVIIAGLKHFHFLNKSENCPSVTRLLDDGFINKDAKGYGSLNNDQSHYSIKEIDNGNCMMLANRLSEGLCLSVKKKFRPEYVARCDGNNLLTFQIKSDKNL